MATWTVVGTDPWTAADSGRAKCFGADSVPNAPHQYFLCEHVPFESESIGSMTAPTLGNVFGSKPLKALRPEDIRIAALRKRAFRGLATGGVEDTDPNATAATMEDSDERAEIARKLDGMIAVIDLAVRWLTIQRTADPARKDDTMLPVHCAGHGTRADRKTHGPRLHVMAKRTRLAGVDQRYAGAAVGEIEGDPPTVQGPCEVCLEPYPHGARWRLPPAAACRASRWMSSSTGRGTRPALRWRDRRVPRATSATRFTRTRPAQWPWPAGEPARLHPVVSSCPRSRLAPPSSGTAGLFPALAGIAGERWKKSGRHMNASHAPTADWHATLQQAHPPDRRLLRRLVRPQAARGRGGKAVAAHVLHRQPRYRQRDRGAEYGRTPAPARLRVRRARGQRHARRPGGDPRRQHFAGARAVRSAPNCARLRQANRIFDSSLAAGLPASPEALVLIDAADIRASRVFGAAATDSKAT